MIPRRHERRRRRSGVALVVVAATLMVLVTLVTDLSYGAHVRFLVAAHHRDRAQAYWLARSGVNIYRLIFTASRQLGNSSAGDFLETMGINAGDALWQMLPVINTGLMRMLFATGGDAGDLEDKLGEEALDEFRSTGKVSDEVREEAAESSRFSDREFLDFDGDFNAEIQDAESRINVNGLANRSLEGSIQENGIAQQLYGLMTGEENEQWLRDQGYEDPWELIGNLADWVDSDTMRCTPQGGYEDSLYNRLDPPYLAKNAPFDSMEEIRLVEGWQGDVFDRFGKNLTVYGNSKINPNSLDDEGLAALLRAYVTPKPSDTQCEQYVQLTRERMMLTGDFASGKQLYDYLKNDLGLNVSANLSTALSKSSYTFTITSTGLVDTSAVTITAVADYREGYEGEVVFWRVD